MVPPRPSRWKLGTVPAHRQGLVTQRKPPSPRSRPQRPGPSVPCLSPVPGPRQVPSGQRFQASAPAAWGQKGLRPGSEVSADFVAPGLGRAASSGRLLPPGHRGRWGRQPGAFGREWGAWSPVPSPRQGRRLPAASWPPGLPATFPAASAAALSPVGSGNGRPRAVPDGREAQPRWHGRAVPAPGQGGQKQHLQVRAAAPASPRGFEVGGTRRG